MTESKTIEGIQMYRWVDQWGNETVSSGHPEPPGFLHLNGGQWPWICTGALDPIENYEAIASIVRRLDELLKEDTVQ